MRVAGADVAMSRRLSTTESPGRRCNSMEEASSSSVSPSSKSSGSPVDQKAKKTPIRPKAARHARRKANSAFSQSRSGGYKELDEPLRVPSPNQLNKMLQGVELGVYGGPQGAQPQTPQTPQAPFTPNGSRFSQPTPSPHYGSVGAPAPDLRSPTLMSPNQQPMQPNPNLPRVISTGELVPTAMRIPPQMPPQMAQQMQQQTIPMTIPGHYFAQEPSSFLNGAPGLCLLGCVFHVFDSDRLISDKLDLQTLIFAVKVHGGEIEFGMKTYTPERIPMITHVIADSIRPPQARQALEHRKRIVTMQWLVDVLQNKKMDVPWKLAHLPSIFSENYRPHFGKLIALAGFDDTERPAIQFMLESLGAKCTPFLARFNNLVIAKSPTGEKVEKAREWEIPVVNYQWLADTYVNVSHMVQDRPAIDNIRYQIGQPSCGVVQSPMVMETISNEMKALLIPWKHPIMLTQEIVYRGKENRMRLSADESQFPNIRLKAQGPPPTADEMAELEKKQEPDSDKPKIVVAFGGFDEENLEVFDKKVRYLGGKTTENLAECTHLVMVSGRRSIRLMEGILMGKNIVSADWIIHSFGYNQWMDTFDYFLRDEDVERHLGYSCKRSIIRARHHQVFEDVVFHVTVSVEPSRDTICHLIRLGGGKIDENRPSPAHIVRCVQTDSPYIVISCDVDVKGLQYLTDCNFPIYNVDLVLMAVMRQQLEAHPAYRVHQPGTNMPPRPIGPPLVPMGPRPPSGILECSTEPPHCPPDLPARSSVMLLESFVLIFFEMIAFF
ncbi:unnamed protein product [Caenorhabditis auriculariae]|uniref:PAX-interacting protein 1 n=1 Tax=Caenorhabditis auriculariae TaxID=2777116 RepID=A0A8S1HTN3_9PELO|nr:unnamed protein product [Caenorhabditis auriculariae]